MTQAPKAIAAAIGLVVAALLMTGCAAIRDFIAEAPVSLPVPSLPAAAEPFEKLYQGGSRPDGLSDEEWETTSERRITLAAALKKILVYGVDHDPVTDAITVHIKGDPDSQELIDDVETYVVPVALAWSPSVLVIIDPSLCAVAGEVRDDTPLCDAVGRG